MIHKLDLYYILCVLVNILVIYIINNKIEFKTNKYIDLSFYILLLLLHEVDIKFAIVLTYVYLIIKLKETIKEN
jgi:hypothetical protein